MVTWGKVVEMVFRGNEKSLPFLCSVVFCAPLFPSLEKELISQELLWKWSVRAWGWGVGSGWGFLYWVGLRLGQLNLHCISSSFTNIFWPALENLENWALSPRVPKSLFPTTMSEEKCKSSHENSYLCVES